MIQCFRDSKLEITNAKIKATKEFKISDFVELKLNVMNKNHVEIVVRECNVTFNIQESITNPSMGSTSITKEKHKKFFIASLNKQRIYVIDYQDTKNKKNLKIQAVTSNIGLSIVSL